MSTIEIKADRIDHIYKQGETIKFVIQSPDDIECDYSILRNHVEIIESGKCCSNTTMKVKADKPSFIKLQVKCQDFEVEEYVGVDPLSIKATQASPDDFQQFWDKKLSNLANVPLNEKLNEAPVLTEPQYQEWNSKWPFYGDYPRLYDDVEILEFEAATSTGRPARGYVAYPAGATPGSLPAAFFTHGAGIGDSDLAKTYVAAQLGFLAIDINAHGLPNAQSPDFYAKFREDLLKNHNGLFKKDRLDKDNQYVVSMYLRHKRAIDFLCSRPEWNGHDVIISGASQGGCLALACAGLDERVSAICAGVPAFCDATDPHVMKRFFLNDDDDAETIEKVRGNVRYISVGNFAPTTGADAYFTAAFRDVSCPPNTIYAAYNRYKGTKRIYNGPLADHGGIPNSIHFDDFAKFMLDHRIGIRSRAIS
jgi:cephalosporin-C deacetylase